MNKTVLGMVHMPLKRTCGCIFLTETGLFLGLPRSDTTTLGKFSLKIRLKFFLIQQFNCLIIPGKHVFVQVTKSC